MSKKEKSGIVYIAINPSFHEDIIKIGMTEEDSVEKRMYSLSLSTPFPYECIKAIRVSNVGQVETALHEVMKPRLYGKGKKEFFKPNEDEKNAILSLLDTYCNDPMFKDVTPIESENDELDSSRSLNLKSKTFFKFSESTMKVENGRKWITKGSKIRKERTKTFEDQDRRRKLTLSKIIDDALRDGIIVDRGEECYEVAKDWEFKRAYLAATIVSGGWCSNRPWKKVDTGEDYATWKHGMRTEQP